MRLVDDAAALLDREIDLLWGTDDCDRTEPEPLLTVAVAGSGTDEVLPEAFPRERRGHPHEVEVRRCRSFVIDRVAPQPVPPRVRLVTSDRAGEALELSRPADRWTAQEWEILTSGRWGPWAMAVDGATDGATRNAEGASHNADGLVIALCFSSRWGRGAAEAGVWTHPDHRGLGLASAVTARWAALTAAVCDVVYYSARPDNTASLAVARRVGGRPIGTIWQLWPATS